MDGLPVSAFMCLPRPLRIWCRVVPSQVRDGRRVSSLGARYRYRDHVDDPAERAEVPMFVRAVRPIRIARLRAAVAAVAAAIDLCKLARGWIVERSGERSLAGHYLAKKCRVDASTANDTN